jgi:hypothetical protein
MGSSKRAAGSTPIGLDAKHGISTSPRLVHVGVDPLLDQIRDRLVVLFYGHRVPVAVYPDVG